MNKYRKQALEVINSSRVVGFEERVAFRVKNEHIKIIEKIIKKDDEKYDSISHFIRCAIIRLIREETKRLK